MPRGINLMNDNGLNAFREAVVRSLPFSLHKKSNYKEFSDLVYSKTGAMLSESTLRRLMQPAARIKPTFHTVNAVSIGIGYTSWNDFLAKNEIEIEFLFLQEINILEFTRTSDFESFCAVVNKYEGTKVHFQVYKRMAMMAVEDRNLEVLGQIFNFPRIFEKQASDAAISFFVSVFVRKLIQFNLINHLIPIYAKDAAAQVHFVEWYVDEYNLSGYFGNMMEHYIIHRNKPNDLLFYHTLMALKNMMLNLPIDKIIAEFMELKKNEYYHFFPKARRLAILMHHFFEDKSKLEDYCEEFEEIIAEFDQRLKLNVVFFMCKVLFAGRNHHLIKYVISKTKTSKQMALDLNSKIFQNELYKYEAFVQYCEGNISESMKTLDLHDTKFMEVNSYEISKHHYETIHSIIYN